MAINDETDDEADYLLIALGKAGCFVESLDSTSAVLVCFCHSMVLLRELISGIFFALIRCIEKFFVILF